MELAPFTLSNLRQLPEEMMVFMCHQCRLPLGDSSNCCGMPQSNGDVLLNAVTDNVVVLEERVLSNYQDDTGSLYQVLQCNGCRSPVGKFFVSTPKELDNQLEMFLLNVAAVRIYSFGSANKQVVKPFDAPVTLENCHEFEEEIKKCKMLLGTLQRKVEAIETYLSS